MRNNLRLIRRALNGNEAAADELGEEIDIGESLCCEIEQLREENKQLRQGDPPAELELPKRIPHAEAYIAGTVEGVPEMYRFRGGQWEACMLLDVLATESHDFERKIERLREERITIDVHQHDWIPGFAEYVVGSIGDGSAMVSINLGSTLLAVARGDIPREEVPYLIAESIMHEVVHVLEDWAGVEFSEERVEGLLKKYREAAEAEDVSDADECEHEWIPRSDYGFDICRKCHTTRQIKAAEAKEVSDE